MTHRHIAVNKNIFEFNKKIDKSFSKYFYVLNDTCKTIYFIGIKIIEFKIYLYLSNENDEINLIHIFEVSNAIKHVDKYIQISNNFKIISFPEHETIYFYDLCDLLNNNMLKVNDFNVKILNHNDEDDFIYSATQIKLESTTNDNNINDICDCIVYDTKFIMVYNNKISHYDFNSNHCKEIMINGSKYNDYYITFSENGDYILINNYKYIYVSDFKKIIKIDKKLDIFINKLTLSNDGNLISFIGPNNEIWFVRNTWNDKNDIKFDKYIINNMENDIVNDNLKLYILDYSSFVNIDKLLVLTIWNTNNNKLYIMTIYYENEQYLLIEPYVMNMNIDNNDIQYMYSNGNKYIYKKNNDVVVCDINKEIPLIIVDNMLNKLKYEYSDNINNITHDNDNIYEFIEYLFDFVNKSTNIMEQTYYEYVIIKLLLIHYKNTDINNSKYNELRKISSIYKKLKLTRRFLIKSCQYMFNINIIEFVGKMS